MIANLRAFRLRGARAADRLGRVTAGKAVLLTPATLEGLWHTCTQLREHEPEQIVIAGGDGTAMRVLSALNRAYGNASLPTVALLPFGTVNTSAHRMGAVGSPWDLLARLLAGQGTLRRQPILELEIDRQVHWAFTFGAGLVSHFFAEYERKPVRGLHRALGIFAKVFFGSLMGHEYAAQILAPVRSRLSVDGQSSALDQVTLLIASVFEDVGLGLRPTYRAASAGHRLQVVATDLPAHRLGPQALRVLRGKALVAPRLVDVLASEFSVAFEETVPVVLDGDSVPCRTATVHRGADLLVWSPR